MYQSVLFHYSCHNRNLSLVLYTTFRFKLYGTNVITVTSILHSYKMAIIKLSWQLCNTLKVANVILGCVTHSVARIAL